MAEYIREGEMVEGAKCDIYARKLNWKGLQADPITGELMTLYELDRNSSTEITEKLSLTGEERALRCEDVHFDIGDKIKARAIQVWVDVKRNALKVEVKEGQSATHGGQLTHTNKRTIGRIKYSFDVYKKLLGHSANSEEKQLNK